MIYDLALILIVASLVTLLFKWLKQPLVLGYIVAGFLVSPHMPYIASVTDISNIHAWADIGVMFLLFALGLEFSFKKVIKSGIAPVIAATTIIASMVGLGMAAGHFFGWSRMDCIFLGGMLSMSSTTIIYKAFDDLGLRQKSFTSLVISVLILEDIFAIVMMILLSSLAQGNSPDGGEMLQSILRIVYFLVLWFVVGLFAIPWLLRSVRRIMNQETTLILSLGLCCAMAVISEQVGFSSAFGAFVMGSIIAETVEAENIAHLVEPVKNLFGAIFFVSVGMLVDPAILAAYWLPIIGIVLTVLVGQMVFGSLGYLFSGQTLKTAMRCGFSMVQIGEFAFIIASLGLSLRVISDFLYPVVVAVSVATIFLTPYMIRFAEPAYAFVERHMPRMMMHRLDSFATSEQHTRRERGLWHTYLQHVVVFMTIYSTLAVAAIVLMLRVVLPLLRGAMSHWWANGVCFVATVILIAPFLRSMVMKKAWGDEAKALLTESRVNAFPLMFLFAVRAVVAVSFVFYLFQYLSRITHALMFSVALLLIVAMIMSRRLRRGSIEMERMLHRNLQSREIMARAMGRQRPLFEGRLKDQAIHISEITLPLESSWSGKTLAELALGRRFGVHVSSILRAHSRINIPGGDAMLMPLDRIQVIGNDEQLSLLQAAVKGEIMPADLEIEKRETELRQVVLTAESPLIGKSLSKSGLRKNYGCMLVGIEQGQQNLTQVDPQHVFQVGDILWIVGEKTHTSAFAENA